MSSLIVLGAAGGAVCGLPCAPWPEAPCADGKPCCNGRVALPLVFTSSAAKIAFDTVGSIWFVFDGVMSVRQWLRARASSPASSEGLSSRSPG